MTPLTQLKPGVVLEMALDDILPDPDQIRQTFDEARLHALAADIKRRGIEQPITVRLNGQDGYIVKHGERRRRAAQLAGYKTVPVILAKAEPEAGDDALDRLFDQYAENMQREDLNAMDMAYFYKRLRDEHKIKVADIPDLLQDRGLKKLNSKTVSNYIRNTTLPHWARRLIQQGQLTASHGKYIFLAMRSDTVLAALKKHIDHRRANVGPGEVIDSVRNIRWNIHVFYHNHYPNLGANTAWWTENFPREATFYDYKKLPEADRKALDIVRVPDREDGDTTPFALNIEAHERLNQIHGKKWQARHDQAKAKHEKTSRTGPTPQRLRDYLHHWLTDWILQKIETLSEAEQVALTTRYSLWLAAGCPDWLRLDPRGGDPYLYNDNPKHGQYDAVVNSVQRGLALFLQDDDSSLPCFRHTLLLCTVPHISFENTCILAAHLHLKIDRDYRPDRAFAALYTRQGLLALCDYKPGKDMECLTKKPVGELRDHYLANAPGVPEDIRQLFETTLREGAKGRLTES